MKDIIKVKRPELCFEGIQIKSLEAFKRFAAAVQEIEEQCGIFEVTISPSRTYSSARGLMLSSVGRRRWSGF